MTIDMTQKEVEYRVDKRLQTNYENQHVLRCSVSQNMFDTQMIDSYQYQMNKREIPKTLC